MVPNYLKPLFQTIILISACRCLDSTPTLKASHWQELDQGNKQ